MATATFRIFRGAGGQGRLEDYTTDISEGMVVLDAVHAIQAEPNPPFDVVIEAVGKPEVWEAATRLVRKGGKVNFFGGCPSGTAVSLDTSLIHYSNLTLLASFHHTPRTIRRAFGEVPALGGLTPAREAARLVAAWNAGTLPLLAFHPASAGHGLNLLHGGSRMAWLSPSWSAELTEQAIARIYRPGQTRHVTVHVCVAAGTVDEMKRDRVIGKMSAQEAFRRHLGIM